MNQRDEAMRLNITKLDRCRQEARTLATTMTRHIDQLETAHPASAQAQQAVARIADDIAQAERIFAAATDAFEQVNAACAI